MMTVSNLASLWKAVVATSMLVAACPAWAQTVDALVRAHDLYNKRQYAEAIQAAADARKLPVQADSAMVVMGRAHLERFRQAADAADLDRARQLLPPLESAKLAPRDRLDWTIAMAELLYFDRRFSTAAEFFETALAHVAELEPEARDWLIEWWASALDQQAQVSTEAERRPIYVRILTRAEDELKHDDRSPTAAYWLSASAVGVGDLDRAWAAAEAAWLRAASAGPAGAKLRDDLDRDRKSTRLNSSHVSESRMPSSA